MTNEGTSEAQLMRHARCAAQLEAALQLYPSAGVISTGYQFGL